MGVPLFPMRTVEDAMVDLIRSAETLVHARASADAVVTQLEARWANNRRNLNSFRSSRG